MAKHNTGTKKRSSRADGRGKKEDSFSQDAGSFGDMIQDREMETVFGALALGFCIGLAIGASLAGPARKESWTERVTAEGLGRRVIETLDQILPNAISQRLHS